MKRRASGHLAGKINCRDFRKRPLGRDAFTVEVYGDYFSQTESYFSFGDFYQPLGMLKQSSQLSMVCATGSRNKRDIFYSRFSSNIVNNDFCCAFLNPDLELDGLMSLALIGIIGCRYSKRGGEKGK